MFTKGSAGNAMLELMNRVVIRSRMYRKTDFMAKG